MKLSCFLILFLVPLYSSDAPHSQHLLLITGQFHGKAEVNKLKAVSIFMSPVHFGTMFYAIIP